MQKTVLSFGAHPDDIEIGCGGAEALLVSRGYRVVHGVLTSGEAGSQKVSRESLAAVREAEARRSAAVLGAADVRFFRFPDGLAHVERAMKIPLIDCIREVRPEIVFTHSRHDEFPDHRLLGGLVLDALTAAAGPWYQETSGEPWSPREVLGYEVWHPLSRYELAVDVTDQLPRKLAALRCHESQVSGIRYDAAVEGLARYRGALTGAGEYAEVFEVIRAASALG